MASASPSPNGTNVTGPGSGAKGSRFGGFPVTDKAPIVRPWKDPSAATMPSFPPAGSAVQP